MRVNINIVTTQYNEIGETNKIELNIDGDLYEKSGHKYIIYKQIEDNKEIKTSLKIENDKVTISRFGALDSILTFKEGKVDKSVYRTNEGVFHIANTTNSLYIKNEEQITVNIDYDIEIMNMFKGRNLIDIEIKNVSE